LLVIDMQDGFDDPAWGVRNNPLLELNVGALIAAWRRSGAPVIHVHHDSPSPSGRLRRGTPGNAPKREAMPIENEWIYRKSVNSAFIGTTLQVDLRKRGIDTLVVVGLTTNHCVSTTVRMAANFGFETFVVADATATFGRPRLDGRMCPAGEVHDGALSDLKDEFAEITSTLSVVAALVSAESEATHA
jgi:nicotinamidase-related amidase